MKGRETSQRNGSGGRSPSLRAALAVAGGFFVLMSAGPVRAQEDIWVPEIPLTRDVTTSARALGMGGAYLAVSDDAHALRHNPAGLARIQRVEFLGSLTDMNRKIETDFFGTPGENSISRTRLSALAFAYPFPTYRGSMVIAAGYTAPWILDRDYSRSTAPGSEPSIEEQIFEEGQIGEWSFGYAVDVAPSLALGFKAGYIHGNRQQDWIYRDPAFDFDIHDVTDVDIDGFTGSLGALSRIGSRGRLGLVVNLPKWITIDGTIVDVPGEYEYVVDEEMTLPYSVAAGVSGIFENLLLAADARYTDWTQIDYEGPLRYWEGNRRKFAYQRTWDVHVGGEYLLDELGLAGVRLRAGLAWDPVPYRLLLEDIIVEDDVAVPIYERADFDPDRLTYSAGLGVLLAESLTIDAAYMAGRYERTGVNLGEEENERRVVVTAAYRLD